MLALTAAHPEGLTPREIVFLAEYLETHGARGTHRSRSPRRRRATGIWLSRGLDQPPVPLERMQPQEEECLYIRFGDLARQAARDLDQLQ
jgi:hypothetical protein